ncbi:HK97 family phage prohead protease [Vibrio parahaemolyticus]|nr:HK97 family phage prohead protease [Vibrio parahaemolyticus]EHU0344306.1 HK97 family phage prohead protease [Vibrio parahaemolyticus]EHU0354340.1 HK97 family phage prohead protease [Vibrio parahaemolyticus]
MSLKNLDIRIKSFDDEGEEGTFTAYANVKWVIDRARDVTIDNSFKWDTERLPKMLVNHDFKQVCGVWLSLEEDEKGLKVRGKFALNTTLGRETYELVKMGALDSLSIGYIVKRERFDSRSNINYLEEIDIREVSIVTFECNQASLIESVKSDELKLNYKSIDEQSIPEQIEQACIDAITPTVEEEKESIEESASEAALNTPEDESTSTETPSLEENVTEPTISAEVAQKLEHLVLAIKLSKISF